MACRLNSFHGPFISIAFGYPTAIQTHNVAFPRCFGRQAGIEFLGQRQSPVLSREHDGHIPRPVFLRTPNIDVTHTVGIGTEHRTQPGVCPFLKRKHFERALRVVELAHMVIGQIEIALCRVLVYESLESRGDHAGRPVVLADIGNGNRAFVHFGFIELSRLRRGRNFAAEKYYGCRQERKYAVSDIFHIHSGLQTVESAIF